MAGGARRRAAILAFDAVAIARGTVDESPSRSRPGSRWARRSSRCTSCAPPAGPSPRAPLPAIADVFA
jgi:hypothetical protein